MGGPGELTGEASQLLALEAKLQIQLGDHHGQAANHICRSKMSKSVLCLLAHTRIRFLRGPRG